jgi:DNA recombination protein RmuC
MQIGILILLAILVVLILLLVFRKKETTVSTTDNSAMDLLQRQLETAHSDLAKEQEKVVQLSYKLAEAQTELSAARKQSEEVKKEIVTIQTQFSDQFKNLAQNILDEKSKHMQEQSEAQIKLLLDPIQTNLSEFEKRIKDVYHHETIERNSLKEELKRLNDNSTKLSEDASNLTNALKADTKSQGNWGELVLERILERSGLSEGVEYTTQYTTSNDAEQTIRPDVIVNLPGDKHLIIDSKVSLTAYSAWVSSENEQERDASVKAHLASVRSHVKLLSEKNYPSAKGLNTPDFVILFTPIEAAFALAIQQDKDLYNDAWDLNIIIVSPTTLLATLRTVSNIWMQERRISNVQAIADEGGKLYDKFVAFMVNMKEIGDKLKSASASYENAMNKLESGRGNIISRTQKMKKLGAKTSKSLDIEKIEQAEYEDENENESGSEE